MSFSVCFTLPTSHSRMFQLNVEGSRSTYSTSSGQIVLAGREEMRHDHGQPRPPEFIARPIPAPRSPPLAFECCLRARDACRCVSVFIVHQRTIAEDPRIATSAAVALCVFGVMANCLFSFPLEISQSRERTWGAYLRSLLGPTASRLVGYALSTGVMAIFSTVPGIVAAVFLTTAEVSPDRWAIAFMTLVLVSAPFMFISMTIGFLASARTSVAIVQILMLTLAFAGGLFLPPVTFSDWLDAISRVLPSRNALELTIWGGGKGRRISLRTPVVLDQLDHHFSSWCHSSRNVGQNPQARVDSTCDIGSYAQICTTA